MNKQLLTSLAIFAFGMLLYWLSGGNFERGFGLGWNVAWSTVCAMSAYCFSGGRHE